MILWRPHKEKLTLAEQGKPIIVTEPLPPLDESDAIQAEHDLMEKQHQTDAPSPYHILINGKQADCYDLIQALGIINPAQQHAFKKIAYAGNRGHKDFIKDMKEAAWSCNRAAELEG